MKTTTKNVDVDSVHDVGVEAVGMTLLDWSGTRPPEIGRIRTRAASTPERGRHKGCDFFKRRPQSAPGFSELRFNTPMARNNRKSARPGTHRKPLSKSLLLPMAVQSARDISLAHHLALAACRRNRGNRHQINTLLCSVYRAYYLQRMGFGQVPFACYEHAQAAFVSALTAAAKPARWMIREQDAPAIERLLALHDRQLSEVPMHRVVEAEKLLRNFVDGTRASPLVSPTSD
ncbi:hypothetical protein [Paraburkholderia sp.]|uniref:hypothetical protein n=1 Tax=Paraburkholderia sp. TaxID=1926495 RepID=UPI002F42BD1F